MINFFFMKIILFFKCSLNKKINIIISMYRMNTAFIIVGMTALRSKHSILLMDQLFTETKTDLMLSYILLLNEQIFYSVFRHSSKLLLANLEIGLLPVLKLEFFRYFLSSIFIFFLLLTFSSII
jgi:hypothetical protein